jgi:hypothetical protein
MKSTTRRILIIYLATRFKGLQLRRAVREYESVEIGGKL